MKIVNSSRQLSSKSNLLLVFRIRNWKLEIGNSLQSRAGFTLIELLLTVSIIITVSLVATPFYARFFNQNAIDNTADQIVHSLRKAQLYSMMGKQNGPWGVDYRPSTITLFQGVAFNSRNQVLDEKYTVNSAVTVNNFTVIFNKVTGLPSSTPTISIIQGTINKTISVTSQGVINRTN